MKVWKRRDTGIIMMTLMTVEATMAMECKKYSRIPEERKRQILSLSSQGMQPHLHLHLRFWILINLYCFVIKLVFLDSCRSRKPRSDSIVSLTRSYLLRLWWRQRKTEMIEISFYPEKIIQLLVIEE